MIESRSLTKLNPTDLKRVASGYCSDSKYLVVHTEKEGCVSFDLRPVTLDKSYVKRYNHYDDETLQRYNTVLNDGYSFGAYAGNLLVGLVIAQAYLWNRSISVCEFHVAGAYRNQGIGRRLMECVAEKANRAGFRIIVCETQNTNATAIDVYRRLGFKVEGIDISFYSNHDYPDGEIAIFMKRRLR
ncbi:MAG: N-acetyltransferase [Candidatus Poribacteria bacterium]|nr:N-acetyltransferase [Candidatus Poribacteria bacterium]